VHGERSSLRALNVQSKSLEEEEVMVVRPQCRLIISLHERVVRGEKLEAEGYDPFIPAKAEV
jgi:hypothetical protein